MKHLTEEQLVWFYYGEERDRAAAGRHLDECESCRAAYAALERSLEEITDALPAAERGDDYGAEVWQRLRPRLPEPAPRASWWSALFVPRRWAVAGAMAVLVVGAFFAGRFWPRPGAPPAQPLSAQVRERILLVAVGDHLERSQMVLLELVNSKPDGEVDISAEQQRAQDLVSANRLYRQAATRAGDTGVASVLDELERVLLEISHSSTRLSSTDFEELRRRIEAQGILFKVRVIDSQVKEKAIHRSS